MTPDLIEKCNNLLYDRKKLMAVIKTPQDFTAGPLIAECLRIGAQIKVSQIEEVLKANGVKL